MDSLENFKFTHLIIFGFFFYILVYNITALQYFGYDKEHAAERL